MIAFYPIAVCAMFSQSAVSDSLQPRGLYVACRSSVHGFLQAGILEWVAIPSSRGSSQPGGLNPGLPH